MNEREPTFDDPGTLLLVVDTPAIRQTVEHVAHRLVPTDSMHLLALGREEDDAGKTTALLHDANRWVARTRTNRTGPSVVTRSGRTVDGRWPTPEDAAATVSAYARRRGTERVLVPADVERAIPGVTAEAFVAALLDAGIKNPTVVTVGRPAIHRRLLVAGSTAGTLTLFVLSLAFYLVLAGTVDAFEVVTGVATAALVAVTFREVTFAAPPRLGRSGLRALRWCLYVPYLLWEVARANLAIAAIVLHPRLPIDPKTVSYPTTLRGELALATLANSVTLTPGTLTVDVDAEEGTLLIHTLTEDSREELLGGSLERAIKFVFGDDGRAADASPPVSVVHTGVSDD